MKHINLRTHEVQNILAGTQTRLNRPVKWPNVPDWHDWDYDPNTLTKPKGGSWWPHFNHKGWDGKHSQDIEGEVKCPFGKVGEVIACKETYQYIDFAGEDNGYVYKESQNGRDWEENSEGWTWRSPVTMPLSACRLWLKVKEIRCEKIQDITEEGAKAEGTEEMSHRCGGFGYYESGGDVKNCICMQWEYPPVIMAYKEQHQSIYGPDSWDRNEWFWIVIFEKTDKP